MGMNPLAASNHPISSAFHSRARFEMCSATTRQLRSTIIVQKRAYIAFATRKTHHTKSGYLLARRFSCRAESLTSRYSGLDGRFSGNSQTSSFWPVATCLLGSGSVDPTKHLLPRTSKQADRPLEPGLRGKTVSIGKAPASSSPRWPEMWQRAI